MELVQSRIVTADVRRLARFYARLVGHSAPMNDYYVEVAAGPASVGFSRCRFTEDQRVANHCASPRIECGETILDFDVADVDAEYRRIDRLGVAWVLPPTTQPWGRRSAILRDPDGHLINLSSRQRGSG